MRLKKKLRSKKTQVFTDFQRTQVEKVPKSMIFGSLYYISPSKNSGNFQKTQVFEYRRICWYSGKCTNKKPAIVYTIHGACIFLYIRTVTTTTARSRWQCLSSSYYFIRVFCSLFSTTLGFVHKESV